MARVLITGTSKGIGFEAALAFGRAGHRVHATMRSPSQSPELAQTAAREELPITVSAMDVDSDESVRQAIAAIQQEHQSGLLLPCYVPPVRNDWIERLAEQHPN